MTFFFLVVSVAFERACNVKSINLFKTDLIQKKRWIISFLKQFRPIKKSIRHQYVIHLMRLFFRCCCYCCCLLAWLVGCYHCCMLLRSRQYRFSFNEYTEYKINCVCPVHSFNRVAFLCSVIIKHKNYVLWRTRLFDSN